MRPRLDILPPQQRALWPELAGLPADFVLYGGTAIALRHGHRESVDFDFFSSAPLDPEALIRTLPWLAAAAVTRAEPGAFACLVERLGLPVRLSFFGGLGHGRVGEPVATDDGVACLAAPLDLLGHKLKVILQRAEGKDYQDIAALLAGGMRLADGLAAARALFAGFPVLEAARALAYRADLAEPERVGPAEAAILDQAIASLPAALPAIPRLAFSLAAEPCAARWQSARPDATSPTS
jgi:hypothetical protein